jgi:DnaJ-class molecular chaperone
MKNWQQIAEEMTALKDTVVAVMAESRRMEIEGGFCPRCKGSGRVVEAEESFSFSIYEMCAMCNGRGKVGARI